MSSGFIQNSGDVNLALQVKAGANYSTTVVPLIKSGVEPNLDLPTGLYFLRLQNEGLMETFRFVIEF